MMNINFRGQRLIPGYDFLQPQTDNKPIKVLVHEFIQSDVFTPFPQDSELQVERLILAGNIYDSIGFRRKAAFYRRFAALKSVTVQSDWQACYDSLLGSIRGFSLTLDPIDYENCLKDKSSSIWPGLHVQLIEELITCCRKIKSNQAGTLAIRHLSFMLHTFEAYLSDAKKREIAQDLEELSTKFGEDSPVPLKLDNGHVIPSVNLTKYPLCVKVTPQPLPFSLRPMRLQQHDTTSQAVDNPFIFTPLTSFKSMSITEPNQYANAFHSDIIWVQDEPCRTTLVLVNTLPFKLNVTSIKLLTDGVPLETEPASLTLEPNHRVPTELVGIPRQSKSAGLNRLEILGYSTHLLGVRSNCKFDMITKSKLSSQIVVEICPPLPKIEFQLVSSSSDLSVDHISKDDVKPDLVVLEAQVDHNIGADLDLNLLILSTGNIDAEYIVVKEKQLGTRLDESLFKFSQNILEKFDRTSLNVADKLQVPIHVNGDVTSLFKSGDSVTTMWNFECSGGLALKEGYCRKCSIKLVLNFSDPITVEANDG